MKKRISLFLAATMAALVAQDAFGDFVYKRCYLYPCDGTGEVQWVEVCVGRTINDLITKPHISTSMPSVTPPTYAGHVFDGYWTSQYGSGTQYYDSRGKSCKSLTLEISALGTVERITDCPSCLYARWKIDDGSGGESGYMQKGDPIVVTFDKQGGIGGTSRVTARYLENMPSIEVPTRDGYTFYGYYTVPGGASDSFRVKCYDASGEPVTVGLGTITLYAHWSAWSSTISIDGKLFTATYGMPMPAITVPTRTGYTFGGYWTGENGSGVQYYTASGESARMWNREDNYVKLYPLWTPNTYTVTLDQQDGITTYVTATYGDSMPDITLPTRSGYEFRGYWTGKDGSGTLCYHASGRSARIWDMTSAMTLYAKWTPVYAVILDNQGGIGGTLSVAAKYGLVMPSITVPTRPGYEFRGYWTGKDGSGTQYYAASGAGARTWDMTSATTLYAKWSSSRVTGVEAKQRYPWNGKVDIKYTLTSDVAAGCPAWNRPFLFVTATNRVDGAFYVSATEALSGDTGTAEGMHHVVWDLNAQGIEFKSDDVVFSVVYATPKYCVIDLSAGANATSYPVSYLADVPNGGWKSEYKTTKLVLRLINPGSFKMCGQYDVTLTKPFYCGIFEVTKMQYVQVTGRAPSSRWAGDTLPYSAPWDEIRGDSSTYNWPESSSVDPATFIGRLQARTGLDFDLPTEAQWEYACRAGTTSLYNNGGDTVDDLVQLGRYSGNLSDGTWGYLSPLATVGSYQPNTWGLYDMHGNVSEWCRDRYGKLQSGVTDPVGPPTGASRVVRGGSSNSDADNCTASYRTGGAPSSSSRGFRLVSSMLIAEGEQGPLSASEAEQDDELYFGNSSLPVAIDSSKGIRISEGVEMLRYSTLWDGDANSSVTITQDGTNLVEGLSGEGEWMWNPPQKGRCYVLTHTTYTGGVVSKVETATFFSMDEFSMTAPYCVIDLSAGTNAVSYPVTYLVMPPDGGFNTDEYKTTKLVLRLIEPGAFKMCGKYDIALTKPFYCGVFEVTQKQYELVMGCNPSYADGGGGKRPVEMVSWDTIRGSSSISNWPESSSVGPATFIGRLQARTGLDFDLPTEAQWEYACRAGTTSTYNSSAGLGQLGRYFYNKSDGKGGCEGFHTTVGSYLPNAWGLYDMHGNVYEWCLDWYSALSSGGIDPVGPSSGVNRVNRGGGWDSSADECTSSYRIGGVSGDVWYADYADCGFRIVRTSPISTISVVTLNLNGGSVGTESTIRLFAIGASIGTLPTPVRDGYTFDGWWTQEMGGMQVTASTVANGNVTYYAQWKANQYTVTFDANGGAGGTSLTQDYGTALSTPTVTRTGYTFMGWSPNVPATVPASNVTYTAQWGINRYTVTFDANGGVGGTTGGGILTTNGWRLLSMDSDGTEEYQSASIGNSASTSMLLTLTGPYDLTFSWKVSSESGHDYLRWYLDGTERAKIGGTGGTWQDVSVAVPAGEHTVKWTYSKDYSAASGSDCGWVRVPKIMPPVLWDHGQVVGELPTPTRTGYTFEGWFTEATGGTQISASTVVTGNMTCYAHWTCVVTFNANGGSVDESSRRVVAGTTVGTLPTPTRAGYSFAGWWTTATGGTQISASTVMTGNMTCYAHWTCIVTFNAHGGSVDESSRRVVSGSAVGALPWPTRAGYSFGGWWTKASGGEQISDSTKITGDVTYYAHWTDQPVLTMDSAGVLTGVCLNGHTDIVIPDGVTSIGDYAFGGCSELTSVAIPDSVTNIGNQAFSGCSGLASITIPDSVTSIGYGAFYGCSGLEEITLPFVGACRGNTGSGDSLFGYIFGTWRYTGGWLTKQYTSSASYDYYIPTKLNKVVVTDETVLDAGAFYNCRFLTSVVIGNGVASIGGSAFSNCSSLTSVTIPDGVMSIGKWAFYNCSGLTSVTIPNSVTNIGASAFYGCSGLEEITLPFVGACRGDIGSNDSDFGYIFGTSSYAGGTKTEDYNDAYNYYYIPSKLQRIVVTDETILVDGVFCGYRGLVSVTISGSVMRIGECAFLGCNGLTSVTMSDSVVSIGKFAFCNCTNLTSVTIPDGVTSIGDFAFDGCSGLTSVTMSDSVVSIGKFAFCNCTNLTSVTIPDGVTSIGYEAFSGCYSLTSVTIPNSVTSIGSCAFFGCSGLTSVAIPDSVTSIGGSAFSGCSGLTSVTIPNSVTNIGSSAFSGCSGLTSVTIPGSVTSIGNWAFSGCSGLRRVYVSVGDVDRVKRLMKDLGSEVSFIEIDTVWIAFDANGGRVGESSRSVAVDGVVGALPTPTRNGYKFVGWFTAAVGGSQITASTKVTASVIYYAHWQENGGGGAGGGDEPSTPTTYTVTYRPGASGTGSQQTSTKTKDVALQLKGAIFSRTGYTQTGWATSDGGAKAYGLGASYSANAAITLYPAWTVNQYTVTFSANGGTGGKTMTLNYGAKLTAPTVTRTGYTFAGWSPTVPATVPAINTTYTAQWTKNQSPIPEPDPTPEPEEVHELYADIDGAAPTTVASEYNGYLYEENSGEVKGTIQVKVGKPGKKDGKASVKATVIIGTKKVTLKAADKGKAEINPDGPTEIELVGGDACIVVFGGEGVFGTYGAYLIDGARNFFTSKAKDEVSAANAILAKWLGSFMVIWDGGTLSVSIAAKGKVKVSGTLANGAKVSVSTAFLVGEEWSCISVAAQKANLAFVLWLSHDGKTIEVEGLGEDVHVGLPGTLANGATFQIDSDEFAAVFGQAMLPYLPDGVPVKQSGTKWTLPKAGKVAYKNGAVDESKLGENPCGLKLTYKAKDGTFKGSFKVYAEVKGKPKATTVNVTGFMLNGVGYGTATIKGKKSSVAVTIE